MSKNKNLLKSGVVALLLAGAPLIAQAQSVFPNEQGTASQGRGSQPVHQDNTQAPAQDQN
jgi:hypothetical protein